MVILKQKDLNNLTYNINQLILTSSQIERCLIDIKNYSYYLEYREYINGIIDEYNKLITMKNVNHFQTIFAIAFMSKTLHDVTYSIVMANVNNKELCERLKTILSYVNTILKPYINI